MQLLLVLFSVHSAFSAGSEIWERDDAPVQDWCYNEESCNHGTWQGSCRQQNQSPINLPLNFTDESLSDPKNSDHIAISRGLHKVKQLNIYWRLGTYYAESKYDLNVFLKWGTEIYNLDSMHLHWGSDNGIGSEHTLGYKTFAGEIHLVYRHSNHATILEALDTKNSTSVLVVAILVDTVPENGETNVLRKISNTLKFVTDRYSTYTGEGNYYDATIDLGSLFKEEYFTYAYAYQGTLTSPPCTPVQWLVLRRPILVTEEDLERSRTAINPNTNKFWPNNYRPLQELENREIRLVKIRYL